MWKDETVIMGNYYHRVDPSQFKYGRGSGSAVDDNNNDNNKNENADEEDDSAYLELNDNQHSASALQSTSCKLILKSCEDARKQQHLPQLQPQQQQQQRRNRRLPNDDLSSRIEHVLDKQFGPLVEALMEAIANEQRRSRERHSLEIVYDEWSDVAMIADHILCYFFCVFTLACCFLIFLYSPHVLAEWWATFS